jgi:DNA uptake protein ComE-like DNA-binding protein
MTLPGSLMATNPTEAAPGPARRSTARTVASFVWAATPLVTLGLLTWAVFLFAAARQRSWWLAGAFAAYLAWVVAFFVAIMPSRPGPVADGLAIVAFLLNMFGGCVHALVIRSQVFGFREPRAIDRLRQAEQVALRRRKLREEGQALAERDPALARQLRIGRPDLARDYDDGGLVDVNAAPAAVLATLPGMTPELAGKAVELRQTRGAFVSVDDMSLVLGLAPGLVTDLAEMTVYLC